MEQRSTQHQLDKQKKNDWFLRFIKGMFIGSGFILPGVSGGALAAIFGLYELRCLQEHRFRLVRRIIRSS